MSDLATSIKEAFNEKAKNAPNPDERYISWGNRKFSPKEIAEEVRNETQTGQGIIHSIERGVVQYYATVDECVDQIFSRPPKI